VECAIRLGPNRESRARTKNSKLNAFDPNHGVGRFEHGQHVGIQYIESDYFTVRGCREAAVDADRSNSHDTFGFAQLEGTIAIRPLSAQKASRNVRNNKDISWEEMLSWPSLGCGRQPTRSSPPPSSSLQNYTRADRTQTGRRPCCYTRAVSGKSGSVPSSATRVSNLEIISEDFLWACTDIINDQIRKRETEQVRATPTCTGSLANARPSLQPSHLCSNHLNTHAACCSAICHLRCARHLLLAMCPCCLPSAAGDAHRSFGVPAVSSLNAILNQLFPAARDPPVECSSTGRLSAPRLTHPSDVPRSAV
jgi:hypothetical protein